MRNKAVAFLRRIWKLLLNNLPMKVMSLVFAVLLSSFVIYSTPTITGDKYFSGIEVNASGQTSLTARNLAVSTNIASVVPSARVKVEVPRANRAALTADMVRVFVDLSSVRQAGKQTVRLTGTSTSGRVSHIWPDTVEVVVEDIDTRSAPVNIELTGKDDQHWYSPIDSRTNPTAISIKGPSSIVQKVSRALVTCDVTNMTGTFGRSAPFTLLDSQDTPLAPDEMALLEQSSRSVQVSVEILPAKQLSITKNESELITGELPEGYEIESVVVQPETITVAGDQALLDGMHELAVEPVDVSEEKSSFSKTRKIAMLDNFKIKSSEEVNVTVNIREKSITERYSDIPISFIGEPTGKTVKASAKRVEIRATGDYTAVKALKKGDLIASVDMTDLASGTYRLPVKVVADNYPSLMLQAEPEWIEISIVGD